MGGGRGQEGAEVPERGDGVGRGKEAGNRGSSGRNCKRESAVRKPGGRGGGIKEGKVQLTGRAAREG